MVRPSLVLATGDLTHAKFPGERLSQQFKAEWEEYGRALQECGLGDMPWLDIRGNHGKRNEWKCGKHFNVGGKIDGLGCVRIMVSRSLVMGLKICYVSKWLFLAV